jgi:hypothetical protein
MGFAETGCCLPYALVSGKLAPNGDAAVTAFSVRAYEQRRQY